MKRLTVCAVAVVTSAFAAAVPAQDYRYSTQGSYSGNSYQGSTQTGSTQIDYARVIRVDPVFDDGRYRSATVSQPERCYERQTTVAGYGNTYGNQRTDGYYPDDGYRDGNRSRTGGSQAGATVATVIGGVLGAVVGSQVGGGSARYATSAIGSMVGGMAGRHIYDQQQRDRTGTVRVCDPVPMGERDYAGDDRSVQAYDVTYEYAGRTYTTRTDHHPGDRIRVRVDVRPE